MRNCFSGLAVRAMRVVLRVAVWVVGGAAVGQPARLGKAVTIVLVGDSTVATGGGWGPGFCAVMTADVTCVDDALNGRSSKSFIDEGAWARALARRGDYYLIQFGHNDQKADAARHTDAETTFAANLKRYISDVRGVGGVPVLVTSLSRRNYRGGALVEDLTAYAAATRRVGAEEKVAVIDLNATSVKLLKGMTQEQADGFDAELHPEAAAESVQGRSSPGRQAAKDRTHLNAPGQKVFGRMVADELARRVVEVAPDVVGVGR